MRNEDKPGNQRETMRKESMTEEGEFVTAFLHNRPSGEIDSSTLFFGEVRLRIEAPAKPEAGSKIDGIIEAPNGLPDEAVVGPCYDHLEIPELRMLLGPAFVEAKDQGEKKIGTTVSLILK
jgi:hypothetical protein